MTHSLFGSNNNLFSTRRVRQIIAVGGGKGGVGKSLVSANLSVALAQMGYTVAAIDLDIGAANLHTTLGLEPTKRTLSDFFQKKCTLADCVTPSGIPNLSLVSGGSDAVTSARATDEQRYALLTQARRLEADYVVFDLGAGTADHTLDFFLAADQQILVLLPEPTSIENAYRFIKTAYYRLLETSDQLDGVKHLIEIAKDPRNVLGIRSPADLYREIHRAHPELAVKMREELTDFHPKIILNQVRAQTDIEIGSSIKTVCQRYFGINVDYLGCMEYDPTVWQAIRRKKALHLEFPNSNVFLHLQKIAQALTTRADSSALVANYVSK